jgi:CRP-like cAMP-binding protein
LIFSNNFIDELALKMKEKIIGPEELIYKEGEDGNKIYFIVRGKVEMFLNIEQYNSPQITISHL